MEFAINGKKFELKFGMKFARELDKVFKVDYQGLQFGMGINMAFMSIQQNNPTVLTDVIKAAISHHDVVPNVKDIDEALEVYAEENDGFEQLFSDLTSALGKSPVAKSTIKKFREAAVVGNVEE
ncbi:tail assembly chaperone [Ornithinibacillus bavariensis]|uniref:tail assembly chaperone n=1 Tax=Ornithinibacillus bavariensis TaxID=545502 RepID=UPI000EDBFE34|nr:hypothetical protein [Ornithinibacillus sp.]